jgi:hypothetical protein
MLVTHTAAFTAALGPERLFRLIRLDTSKLDHFGPLLGFVGNQLSEVGGREHERGATEVGKPRLELGVGEARIDLGIEFSDDLGRRVSMGCPRSAAEREIGRGRLPICV